MIRTTHGARRHSVSAVFIVLSTFGFGGVIVSAHAQNGERSEEEAPSTLETSHVEPRADRLLQEMGAYLSALEQFTFQIEIGEDVELLSGQMVRRGARSEVWVRRPGELRVERQSDLRHVRVYIYDGVLVVHDVNRKVFAQAELPTGIDNAIDHIVNVYGVPVPAADLLYADPYATLIASAESGTVVGSSDIDGVRCHHLAFSNALIDWQIWIEDGVQRVPRQLVITYRNEPGSPQYTARFSHWEFRPELHDFHFEFVPPEDAVEIEFLPNPSEEDAR